MTSPATVLSPHRHPDLASIFRQAEGKYFTDAEFAKLESIYPNLSPQIAAAKDVRAKETGIVGRSVKEIYTMYPYEQHHDHATAKCVRDARYVLAYATLAMLIDDTRWFEDKLLIWMKTILQAFDFPEHGQTEAMREAFAKIDPTLAAKLKPFKGKVKSIYHMYYVVKRECQQELDAASFRLMAPYLDLAMNVLSEEYGA
ncbi:MAG: hypothetical protein SNJ67_06840 [Chloracidobacterium sp.]|uniref:Phycobilisome protein n=1 Tax=Chloracidobacterium validum TaxID=2821543 RepID=A0ABX8B9Y4_9BACT|nr:hypothetical protein [Chloracidobacterium validum]QUW03693.1 hypothetical protein J8C06_04470 [Chloracidobacterium validum]